MADTFIPPAKEESAEFNSALALLERINKIEYFIEDSLINWNLRGAYSYLESYENELDFSFKTDERKEVEAIKEKILIYFSKYPNMGRLFKNVGENHKRIMNPDITPIVRDLLIKLNKTLRRLKHSHGMGMPKRGEGKLF